MGDKKKFIVATAIPYVNAKPHLGTALLFLYGDVVARYWRQMGREVIFSVGTDEHGGKNAQAAQALSLTPQAFVDQMTNQFKKVLKLLGISYTHFTRTTDASHIRGVQYAWRQLEDHLYLDTYRGWYCQGCEEFKTDTVVKQTNNLCPDHLQPYQVLEEKNYFFKVSSFTDEIRDRISSDRLRIVPAASKAEVLSLLDQGIEDVSVTRPKSSNDWGIPVPGDEDQVMYVWFEALLNYITVLGSPEDGVWQTIWPAELQIIGRDILRFHAVLWPAILLALRLPIYRQLYAHGLLTVEGRKMSKSLGNVVDPMQLVDEYGLEAFRYYVLRHIPSYDNGDYQESRLVESYNSELVDQLGNLVHRLQALIRQKLQGNLPRQARADLGAEGGLSTYHQLMNDCRFDQALNLIFSKIKVLNRRLEETSPWRLEDKKQIADILDQLTADLIQCLELLQPFLPDLSQRTQALFSTRPIKPPLKPPLSKIAKTP